MYLENTSSKCFISVGRVYFFEDDMLYNFGFLIAETRLETVLGRIPLSHIAL